MVWNDIFIHVLLLTSKIDEFFCLQYPQNESVILFLVISYKDIFKRESEIFLLGLNFAKIMRCNLKMSAGFNDAKNSLLEGIILYDSFIGSSFSMCCWIILIFHSPKDIHERKLQKLFFLLAVTFLIFLRIKRSP